jgi:small nuclear ribonucleoprotein B and B'
LRYVEHRLRVTLHDGRAIVGTFLAFDKHLNLVLSEAEEFRSIQQKAAVLEERTEKRSLGLILIRGENVVSLAVEGPPPVAKKAVTAPGGPGQVAQGAGRGMLPPPPGGYAGPPPGAGRGMSMPPPPY